MNEPTRRLLALRGRALRDAVARLVALRARGYACDRCARLLAPGATCPDHGARRPRQADQARAGRGGW